MKISELLDKIGNLEHEDLILIMETMEILSKLDEKEMDTLLKFIYWALEKQKQKEERK